MSVNIYGIGTDLVETARLARSISRLGDAFLRRCFTDSEIAYCQSHSAPELPYAARFAAKEAVSKAFGTGIGDKMNWTDIEVCRLESGQPTINLLGAAKSHAESLGVIEIKLSLTHTNNYAAAYALVLVKSNGQHA